MLLDLGLKQHVVGSTHDKQHTLDLVITPEGSLLVEVIHKTAIVQSDHLGVIITTNIRKNILKTQGFPRYVEFRSWGHVKSGFMEYINECLDNVYYQEWYDADSLYELFETVTLNAVQKYVPFCKKTKQHNSTPWYSAELRQLKIIRRRSERKWRQSKLHCDLIAYKEKCKTYAETEKQTKQEYYQKKLQGNNPSTLFKVCGILLIGHTSEEKYPTCPNNNILANKFNSFFINKVENIMKSLAVLYITTLLNMKHSQLYRNY